MRGGTGIQLWHAYRSPSPLPRRPLTRWIAIGLGLVWLAFAMWGCGVRKQDAANALDGLRQLHYSLCIEHEPAPEDVPACERSLARLRVLEPSIEDQLAKGAGLLRAWEYAKPYAWQLARQAASIYAPWLAPWLPAT